MLVQLGIYIYIQRVRIKIGYALEEVMWTSSCAKTINLPYQMISEAKQTDASQAIWFTAMSG